MLLCIFFCIFIATVILLVVDCKTFVLGKYFRYIVCCLFIISGLGNGVLAVVSIAELKKENGMTEKVYYKLEYNDYQNGTHRKRFAYTDNLNEAVKFIKKHSIGDITISELTKEEKGTVKTLLPK